MKVSNKYLLVLLIVALMGAAGFFALVAMDERSFANQWAQVSIPVFVLMAFFLGPLLKILDEE